MAITAVGNAATPLASLVSMPILTYTLGVTGRGELAAAAGPLLLAVTAATFGIPEAVTYFVARHPRMLRAAALRGMAVLLVAGVVATVACISASGLLSKRDPDVGTLIVVASMALIPTMLVLVVRASAAGLHRWKLVAAEQMITAIGRLLAIVVLALCGSLTTLTATIVVAAAPVLGGLAYLPLRSLRLVDPSSGASDAALRSAVGMGDMVGYGSRIWRGSIRRL